MIPTYNQAHYLGQAIGSALVQDYGNLEVVISDDCSTDETPATVQKFNDPRVKYFRNKTNLGRVGNYRKLLYEYASGDYVLLLDGDDYLTCPDYISKAISVFEKDGDVVLVFSNHKTLFENSGQHACADMHLPLIMNGNWLFLNYYKKNIWIPHLTAVYNRQAALAIDFYRLDIESSDWESILRLILNKRVGFINTEAGVWRIHQSNQTSALDIEFKLKNISFIDSVSAYVSELNVFQAKELEAWKMRMLRIFLTGYFSKYIGQRRYKDAKAVFILASKKNWKLAFYLISGGMAQGCRKVRSAMANKPSQGSAT